MDEYVCVELETGSQIFNFKVSIIFMATKRESKKENRGKIRKNFLWELKEPRIYFESMPIIP